MIILFDINNITLQFNIKLNFFFKFLIIQGHNAIVMR
jgi:hypothetical protein